LPTAIQRRAKNAENQSFAKTLKLKFAKTLKSKVCKNAEIKSLQKR
jgi:hypothetical protein